MMHMRTSNAQSIHAHCTTNFRIDILSWSSPARDKLNTTYIQLKHVHNQRRTVVHIYGWFFPISVIIVQEFILPKIRVRHLLQKHHI